ADDSHQNEHEEHAPFLPPQCLHFSSSPPSTALILPYGSSTFNLRSCSRVSAARPSATPTQMAEGALCRFEFGHVLPGLLLEPAREQMTMTRFSDRLEAQQHQPA